MTHITNNNINKADNKDTNVQEKKEFWYGYQYPDNRYPNSGTKSDRNRKHVGSFAKSAVVSSQIKKKHSYLKP